MAQKIYDTKESNSPSEYVKSMEKLIREIKALEKKLDKHSSRLKKLEDDIDDIDNRVDTIFSKE